jgi:serine/threonine-protein kinase
MAAFATWRLQTSPVLATRQLARFALPPPPHLRFAGGPAISPDGTLVVFPAGEGPADKQRLYFRRLDQLTTTALPATEGADLPFFSPDGKSVGFLADNQLKTIRLDATASPVVICAARSFLGGAWAADGTIIFGSFYGLQRVNANGGVPQSLTIANPVKSDIASHLPSLLPGGRALLISVHDGDALFRIDVLTLATGERRTVVARGYHAEYSPTGHIVYAAGDALFAVPFDVDRLTAAGTPVKLVDGVETDGVAGFALSATGTLVFQPQPPPPRRTLVWADRSGVTTPIRSSRGRSGHRACRRMAGSSPSSSMTEGV